MARPGSGPPGWQRSAHCDASLRCARCWAGAGTEFAAGRITRRYPAGIDVAPQGEPPTDIITLLDGWLLLYELLSDGRRQILHIAVPGDVLVPPLDGSAAFGIQAATEAILCTVPFASVTVMQAEYPATLRHLMTVMSRNAAIAYEHLTAVGRRTARERVALLLVELYYRCRQAMPVDRAVRIPLTQSILADALGLTAVHVNRTLKTLRAEGLIVYENNALRILDPDRLAAAACFEVEAAGDWLRRGLPLDPVGR